MKKNWTMRVAVLMVALTLITSCFVSSTYAKYVVSGGADETARVAKFGVTITAGGTLFADTYKAATANTPGADGDNIADATSLTVVSSASGVGATTDKDNVVAPGTKNDTGMTFTVTGTPEVAVRVFMDIDANAKEIFLKAKNGLPDMTTADAADTFDQAEDYYPVQFTLTIGTVTKTGTLAEIKDALAAATDTVYPANTNLATAIGTIKLTWAWDFGDPANNKPDTLLGDLAAGTTLAPATTLTADTDYCLTEAVKINVGIAQVD